MHDGAVPDVEPAALTVLDRLTAAGLSEEQIAEHMSVGRGRVAGEHVSDRDTPAPTGTRAVVWSE
jgi:hypothetical protein